MSRTACARTSIRAAGSADAMMNWTTLLTHHKNQTETTVSELRPAHGPRRDARHHVRWTEQLPSWRTCGMM
eukprot:2796312-Rhodomonas_salina.1